MNRNWAKSFIQITTSTPTTIGPRSTRSIELSNNALVAVSNHILPMIGVIQLQSDL